MVYTIPNLPCSLPVATIPRYTDLEAVSKDINHSLELLSGSHFTSNAIWRDSFAMTGTMRTFYGPHAIGSAWQQTSKATQPSAFKMQGGPKVVRMGPNAWVELEFTFETTGPPATTCSGMLSVVPGEDGEWKIWVMRTILEQLKGQGNVDILQQVTQGGHADGVEGADGVNSATGDNGTIEVNAVNVTSELNGANGISKVNGVHTGDTHFDCVIVGGGQAGLSTGGRLKALGVSYVILEKQAEVGDSWKSRYDSTKCKDRNSARHLILDLDTDAADSTYMSSKAHLPFERTFPASYNEYLTKNDLARGYQEWVAKYDVNVWLSTKLEKGKWIADREIWELEITKQGEPKSISASYIVFAVGAGSQVPVMPTYENREAFKGIILHSGEYHSAKGWAGKHGVVVGTANTGHDVAEDMLAANLASVTMIQRSKTYVLPAEHYRETQTRLYNNRIPTETADRLYFSGPLALGRLLGTRHLHAMARADPERFDALERVGFKLDRFGDIFAYLFERFGGHYMDVGASAKIAKGLIKIKSDALPVRYTEDGIQFDNGDHLRVDVIVFATGFVLNTKLLVANFFGAEVAAQIDDFWGTDEEGELKGAYKTCGHPAFWFHGGAIGQARYMARFIALQIKAKLLGTPLPLYEDTPR
ncbi:uncharacterized protein N7482_000023 [Penicillium canariense]|uniref:FAD/NAD(P)-binding domain-containing protein n=1 Tax=Penicillium canariense TaxID=189055 RepID=A0A9W9IH26_9EURO|nr:uncharacterized protein N7482_000023 [Penicillium canariense]KAJ5174146.1 hypothetical protein N7482_000023 [Penicillium canariense]